MQSNCWLAVTKIQRKIFKFLYKSYKLIRSFFVIENKSLSRSTNADDELSLCLICAGNNDAVNLVLIHFNQFLNLEVKTSSHWDFYNSCYPVAHPDNLQNMQAKGPVATLAQESGMKDKSIKFTMIIGSNSPRDTKKKKSGTDKKNDLGDIYSCRSLQ